MRNPASSSSRIAGLDAWRAALILAGVLLHGSAGLQYTPLFGAISIISQAFRMGAFYGIAGVLTALALSRRPPEEWIRRRVVQLAVPLAFGLLVISPTIWALVVTIGPQNTPPPSLLQWYHLWFLAGLLLYSLLAFLAASNGRDARCVAWLDAVIAQRRVRPTIVLLAVSSFTALLFALPFIARSEITGATRRDLDVLQLIVGYLPMFAFGYLIARSAEFARLMQDHWLPAALIVVIAANVYAVWFLLIAPTLSIDAAITGEGYIRLIGSALCPPGAFVLILRSALSIRAVPAIVSRLSQASYTIYLLHYPVALTINFALDRFTIPPLLCYAVAVIGSASLCFVLHEHVVRRSATLSLLLNGRWRGPQSVAAAT